MSVPSGIRTVPLKPIDQRPPVGTTRTVVYFIIRDILDQELLRTSLDNLIRNHLPILGGRIKRPEKKRELYQYHYPEVFPADATLFAWSSKTVQTTLEASGLLPDVSSYGGAVVWGRPLPDHEDAWTPEDWPGDFLDDGPDTSLFLVHVTSYDNATVLAVSIPHAVADQKGLASMMEAWLLVARGQTPPPFIQLPPGALDGPSDLPQGELRRKGQYRTKTKAEHIRTILSLLPDLIRNREEERRTMFLNASVVSGLRDRFNEASKQKYGSEHVTLTNGDIVSCILAKLSNLDKKRSKYLSIGETVNARGRHASLPTGGHYLHNCPAYACARMKYCRDTPLSDMARSHRLAVNETATPAGVERSFAVTTKVFEGAYALPIGEPGDMTYHVTNWSSAWHNIDFSCAVQKQNTAAEAPDDVGTSRDQRGMLVLGHAVHRKQKVRRLHAPILCKADGGYWCDFSCSTKNMALVDELLKKDPMLDTL